MRNIKVVITEQNILDDLWDTKKLEIKIFEENTEIGKIVYNDYGEIEYIDGIFKNNKKVKNIMSYDIEKAIKMVNEILKSKNIKEYKLIYKMETILYKENGEISKEEKVIEEKEIYL